MLSGRSFHTTTAQAEVTLAAQVRRRAGRPMDEHRVHHGAGRHELRTAQVSRHGAVAVADDQGRHVGIRADPTQFARGQRLDVSLRVRIERSSCRAVAMHEFHHVAAGQIIHTWHLEDWAGWREQVTAPTR